MKLATFLVLSGLLLGTAAAVVRVRNMVHAVYWLAAMLVSTAALYALLGASFLAGVQVLLYVGGVVTLMIFGVMITRRHEGIVVEVESTGRGRALFASIGLFLVLASAILTTPGLDGVIPSPAANTDTAAIGRLLLGDHLLSFEAVSLLLLAVIVGAIVIARRRDHGRERRPFAQARVAAPSSSSLPEAAE